MMRKHFGYRCEFCDGTVKAKRVDREASKHRSGFVIVEEVTIGVCDQCGTRDYSADVLTDCFREGQANTYPARAGRPSRVIQRCAAMRNLVAKQGNSYPLSTPHSCAAGEAVSRAA